MEEWVKEKLLNMKEWKEGHCAYLINNQCAIYNERPSCCRNFPDIENSSLCKLVHYCALKEAGTGLTAERKSKICFECGAECCKKILIPKDLEFSGRDFTEWLGFSCKECNDIEWCRIIPSELLKQGIK